ncbi:hypothetical protein PybrP1_001904 [[Pythium] brassicae (nom. inval.)]|nr:hypothetical protein PybrP1_001904 [[Pythium] brassicae (nom. inval.)]
MQTQPMSSRKKVRSSSSDSSKTPRTTCKATGKKKSRLSTKLGSSEARDSQQSRWFLNHWGIDALEQRLVLGKVLEDHTVRPAKADLRGVLAAHADAAEHCRVVLLEHLPRVFPPDVARAHTCAHEVAREQLCLERALEAE